MSGKKGKSSDRLGKPDKTMPDPHREYLDMDTDEEEFGRQESLESKEELPPEPEKPVYSEEHLLTLVEYVKRLVVLPSLKDADWNEGCYETIREYFRNPSYLILSIFYKGNILTASLCLPESAPKGFTYFTRSSWHVFTTDNFFSTILFGSVSNEFENSILKFMENIYAPVALNSEDHSPLIRNDVFTNLHSFLMCLTEKVYKSKGLTVLYIPREHHLKTVTVPSKTIDCFLLGKDKETTLTGEEQQKQNLIGRLEKIIWCWIRQIREATKTSPIRKNIKDIVDEVNYWNAMYLNLNYLHIQLTNADVRLIIDILSNFRTPSVELFQELTIRVRRRLEEASSNLKYLNVLSELCKNLDISEETNDSITRALLLILFIWTDSPFYNTMNHIETLCCALSSQIIQECKKYIKLDVAFGSDPNNGIKMLERCILCCNNYKTIYEKLIQNVAARINCNKNWDINETEVFNKLDTFKQRCYDVIEICQALIVFGRYNKVGLLGSPKGTEYEAYCRKTENLFYESLNEIIMVRGIIFDVSKSRWLQQIDKFRNTVKHLENMVKNLINDIFDDVRNIDEGIEAIYALQKFKQRESLREILQSKWTQVWDIFNNEVKYCYVVTINETAKNDQSVQYYGRRESMACIGQYLRNQYTTMINASDWIGDCTAEKFVSQQYKHVLDAIDERRQTLEI